MNNVSSFSLLLFLLTVTHLKLASAASGCHADDQAGLLAFKSGITRDPSGMLTSWKPGTDCCSWSGVTCLSGPGTRVTGLWLSGESAKPNSYLSGTISPSLSKLQSLLDLHLMDLRNISGPFPDVLFKLPNLVIVYLENSKLSGPLPQSIGQLSKLDVLSVEGNRFTGPIPSSVSQMSQLTRLQLGGNFLTGTIPAGIRELRNLTQLSLKQNQLSGQIPDIFSSLTNLYVLELSGNRFSGNIPPSIASLAPRLRFLELGHNSLTGRIPDFLAKFRALDTLDLSSNKFSGAIPKSFANLTKIFNLDLSRNLLTDPFPQLYVKGIESLDLSYNQFNLGQIPKWITSSPIIYSLKLAGCGIKMKIDDWKPAETYFYDFIDLSDNQISGSPVNLLNRTEYLVEFRASNNKLKFDLATLKIPKTLKQLDLSRNLVFGKVPATLSALSKLNVSHNHLCGQLPASKFPADAFAGNDCLCGSPLPPCKR